MDELHSYSWVKGIKRIRLNTSSSVEVTHWKWSRAIAYLCFIIGMLNIPKVSSSVIEYEWNACWNIPVTDDTLFWYGSIDRNLSASVYNTVASRDLLAKSDYDQLLARWRINDGDSTLHPNNDWLAIARDVYCAYRIPSCGGALREEQPLCKFVWKLWEQRCPQEYDERPTMWATTSSDNTWSYSRLSNSVVMFLQTAVVIFMITINF